MSMPLFQTGSANILRSIYQHFLCCSDHYGRCGQYSTRQESVRPLAEPSTVSQSVPFCNKHCFRLWYVGVDLCGHRFWLTYFSTAGHVAFFSFISEFKNPKDFPKALFLLQICDVSMYIVVAVVVYRYAGDKVSSPALGSAGKVVSKVAYGVAIPTVWPSH
jgi:hypothetical protein